MAAALAPSLRPPADAVEVDVTVNFEQECFQNSYSVATTDDNARHVTEGGRSHTTVVCHMG
jgi:hypothetical protein